MNLIGITITLGRAEKFDILCVSPDEKKTYKISVKTRFKYANRFPMSQKDETGGSDDFFYAFIILNEFKEEPDFWIIPSKRVNQILSGFSQVYFGEKKSKTGQAYNDVGLRNFLMKIVKTNKGIYPDNWEEELEGYKGNIGQLK